MFDSETIQKTKLQKFRVKPLLLYQTNNKKLSYMLEYTTTQVVFFSPTGTSARIARSIAEGVGMGRRIETDLTLDEATSPVVIENSLTIISIPVYAGRVAPIALKRLSRLQGKNSPAILVAVYGNRDYEDALVELRDVTVKLGFTPLSAGAFIGEHSYCRAEYPIAPGRPDAKDVELARQFGVDSLSKLQSLDHEIPSFYIKGNIPYRYVGPSTPACPVCTDDCSSCGTCIDVCPTHAIRMDETTGQILTDVSRCIKCCACVKSCPASARIFDTPYSAMLSAKCSARREPELFL